DVILLRCERELLTLDGKLRSIRGRDACQRHALDVGAVGIAWLQTHLPKLLLDPGNGLFLAGRAGLTALELIRRKRFDFTQQRLLVDAGERGLQRTSAGSQQRCQEKEREKQTVIAHSFQSNGYGAESPD